MDSAVAWLQATAISVVLRDQSGWLWPMCESLHFIGLSLLVGVAGFVDLRLLGAMNRVPIRAALGFLPWAQVGFGINLLTGLMFFIARPDQYLTNASWWLKVTCLFIAGVNVVIFETTLRERLRALAPGEPIPRAAKVVAAVSLIAWFGVLYFGRMLPYLDPDIDSGA